jgi:hypothetical protein
MTASARQRSQASAAFAEASYRSAIVRSRIRNRCDDQQSTMLRRARRGGGRNARATSRAVRVSGSLPPAIHSRELPAAAGSAAIIQQSQELSRFAAPTFIQIVATRNTKNNPPCAETVDVEHSLWKPEEN